MTTPVFVEGTVEEYFAQTLYFSESAQEFIGIETMAFPHARFAHRKLLGGEHREQYIDSALFKAFRTYLNPTGVHLKVLLKNEGKVAIATPIQGRAAARQRIYRMAKSLGIEVKTWYRDGVLHAERKAAPLSVTIKGKTFSQ